MNWSTTNWAVLQKCGHEPLQFYWFWSAVMKEKEKKKNYAGSKTLPASIKEKETHWPEVPLQF